METSGHMTNHFYGNTFYPNNDATDFLIILTKPQVQNKQWDIYRYDKFSDVEYKSRHMEYENKQKEHANWT